MLIDSNILIYALNSASPKHTVAKSFIQNEKELIVTQQNIFECLRILTHTKFPNPFSTLDAIRSICLITNNAQILSPTFDTTEIAFELIKKYKITGTEVFDAYLVATALSHEIREVATDNVKHLKKYREIRVSNPFK